MLLQCYYLSSAYNFLNPLIHHSGSCMTRTILNIQFGAFFFTCFIFTVKMDVPAGHNGWSYLPGFSELLKAVCANVWTILN